MATYLSLVNAVLRRLNEVQLTSSNFGTTTVNFQAAVKDYVNDALHDIYNAEREWPFNIVSSTQELTPGVQTYTLPTGYGTVDWDSFFVLTTDLVTNGSFTSAITGWTDSSTGTGSSAYSSDGNGRLRLNAGASGTAGAYQALNTIAGKTYKVFIRTFGGTVTMRVGTTVGGSDLLTATELTFTEAGGGQFFSKTFTATGATSYIEFYHSDDADYDIDYVSVFENVAPKHLRHITFDEWRQRYRPDERRGDPINYQIPLRVYFNHDGRFGVSPIPDKSYTVEYDYYQVPDDLDAYDDEPPIPDKYKEVIIDGAMYYAYMFRDNLEQADDARTKLKLGISRMRQDLINKDGYMRTGP
jgi:hypothetical protein